MATVDVNEDNIVDLVLVLSNSKAIGIMLGNGDSTFQPLTTYTTGVDSDPTSVKVAGMNGDTKLDLVVGVTNKKIGVLLGNGSGGFQPIKSGF